MNIGFGTDGIRGSVESVVTPMVALKLGWAAGKVLAASAKSQEHRRVVVGKDTRISGYMLESALEAGFIAAGVDVVLIGPVPTPAVAYLTRSVGASAGAMISASHNPYPDNGIKLFNGDGGKISPDLEAGIEHYLGREIQTVPAASLGRASRLLDAAGRYLEFCKSALHLNDNLSGMRLVVDCANGSGYQILPKLLGELGAEVEAIHNEPDGFNINRECGSIDTKSLGRAVRRHRAHYGIAVDGDADRLILLNRRGRRFDGDDILYLLASSRYRWHSEHYPPSYAGVVGTQLTNFGLAPALARIGVTLVCCEVGDRNVAAELEQRDWVLGAEESGHIINTEHHATSDAAIAAVQVLDVLKAVKKPFHRCIEDFERCPRERHDMPVANPRKALGSASLRRAIDDANALIGERGRIVVRASGTEPVLRFAVDCFDEGSRKRAFKILLEGAG
ncbi:MAG: phosphoglucosamine mutase [Gammaproteobacteria bacterium AqS3]|nr:phosphoglucosamine mutase [Gammaproteobacteria bacterium AqS3]